MEELTADGTGFKKYPHIAPFRKWKEWGKRYAYVVGECKVVAEVVTKPESGLESVIAWLGENEDCKEAEVQDEKVVITAETQPAMARLEAALGECPLLDGLTINDAGRSEGYLVDRFTNTILPASEAKEEASDNARVLPISKVAIMAQCYSALSGLDLSLQQGFFVKVAAAPTPTKRVVISPNPMLTRNYTGPAYTQEITARVSDLLQTPVTPIVPLIETPPFETPLTIFTIPASTPPATLTSLDTAYPYISKHPGAVTSHDIWYDCRTRRVVSDPTPQGAGVGTWATAAQVSADLIALRSAVLDIGLHDESAVTAFPSNLVTTAADCKAKWNKDECKASLITNTSKAEILDTSRRPAAAAAAAPATTSNNTQATRRSPPRRPSPPPPPPRRSPPRRSPPRRPSPTRRPSPPRRSPPRRSPPRRSPPRRHLSPRRSPQRSSIQHLLNAASHNDRQCLKSAKVYMSALFRVSRCKTQSNGYLAIHEYYDDRQQTNTFQVTVGPRVIGVEKGPKKSRYVTFLHSLQMALKASNGSKLSADISSAEGNAPYLFNKLYKLTYGVPPEEDASAVRDRDRERSDRERGEQIERERVEAERRHKALEVRRREEERKRVEDRRREEDRKRQEEKRRLDLLEEGKKREEAMMRRRDEMEMQRRKELDRKRLDTAREDDRKRRREEPRDDPRDAKKKRLNPSIVNWYRQKMETGLIGIRKPIIVGLTEDAHRSIANAEEIVEGWETRLRQVNTPTQSLACWYLIDSIAKQDTNRRFRDVIEPRLSSLAPYLPSRLDPKHRDQCYQLLQTWRGLFSDRVITQLQSQI